MHLPGSLREVSFTDGVAHSTSINSKIEFHPKEAFKSNSTWRSIYKPPQLFPAYIWYDFRSRRIRPTLITFLPRQDRQNSRAQLKKTPSKFRFVGTNDAICNEDSDWSILCEGRSNDRPTIESLTIERGCHVSNPDLSAFRCLGLKIDSSFSAVQAVLSLIRIWQMVLP